MRVPGETRKHERLKQRYARELFNIHFAYCQSIIGYENDPEHIEAAFKKYNHDWVELAHRVNKNSVHINLNVDGFKNMVDNKVATRLAMGKKTFLDKFKSWLKR